jgi:hypothetical protein
VTTLVGCLLRQMREEDLDFLAEHIEDMVA